MDLDQALSDAFDAWSDARTHLGTLRKEAARLQTGRGQMAQAPEVMKLFAAMSEAEAVCESRFQALIKIAERRAEERGGPLPEI